MTKATTKNTPSALEIIDRNIEGIKTKGKALRNSCHETLVMIVDHYIEHGDYTRLPKLEAAIKGSLGSSLSAAMNSWVARFVPSLRWNDEDKAFRSEKGVKREVITIPENKPVKMKSVTGPDDKPMSFYGDARKLPFFELEREVAQKPFDFDAAVKSLIKRAMTAVDGGSVVGDKSKVQEHVLLLRKAALGMGVLNRSDFTEAELMEDNGPQGADLAKEAENVKQLDATAGKARGKRGRKAKTQENVNEPVADAA